MRKLIIATGNGYPEVDTKTQIDVIARVGWDGVFTGWNEENGNGALAEYIASKGLVYQSIHAPFNKIDTMWEDDELGEWSMDRMIRCIKDCADAQVPIMVLHTIIGMEKHTPNELGLYRFGKVIEAAEKYGVNLGFENTEGEEYLEAILNRYADSDRAGFCIDTGHEMCYNERRDLITKYGKKLICTHLNDNWGRTAEKITWHDDAHLLPFDGSADWQAVANRLNSVGYGAELSFELTSKSKPERNANDIYNDLDFEGFVSLALERAKKFRSML